MGEIFTDKSLVVDFVDFVDFVDLKSLLESEDFFLAPGVERGGGGHDYSAFDGIRC